MEVRLDKRYPVAASLEAAWAVLADIRATAACMPGAQITEEIDATHYKGLVKTKVGPAMMAFNGDIEVLELDAGARRLRLLGKGADKAGSSAAMELGAWLEPGDGPEACTLVGQAVVTVSGKLAQFGNRLLVPVSDAMLQQFAARFTQAAQAEAAQRAQALQGGPADDEPGSLVAQGSAGAALGSAAASPPAPRAAVEPRELNALALLWTVLKGWIAGLFGGKRS